MIDQAGIMMAQGAAIASERIAGVNDNMTSPITTIIMRFTTWRRASATSGSRTNYTC